MRHHRLWSTLTLVGTTLTGSMLLADTPVKPIQASFPSAASKVPPTQALTVSQAEKLVQNGEIPPVVEKKIVIDYTIKAASIEVGWLQDASTYPLHLRAEHKPGEEAITLSGFVPSERLKDKAISVAKSSVGNLPLIDHLVVHPQMSLPADLPVDREQTQIVQGCLEKAVPGVGKALQLTIDANGIATVSGRVDEFSDRLKLIRALQGIPGCTSVRYDLRISMQTQQTVAASTSAGTVVPASSTVSTGPVKVPVVKATAPEPKQIAPIPAVKLPSPPKHLEPVPIVKETPVPSKSATVSDMSQSASAIVQAGSVEPVNHFNEKFAASSLSGLFPPGMSGRSTEPGIVLGSPIAIRATYEINLDVMGFVDATKTTPKASDITQTSTNSVTQVLQAPPEHSPIPINVMPRLVK